MKPNTGIEPVTTRFHGEKGFAVCILNLVENSGIEPLTVTCKATVFPIIPIPQCLAGGLGIEPRLTESKSVVLPLHNPPTYFNSQVRPSTFTGSGVFPRTMLF